MPLARPKRAPSKPSATAYTSSNILKSTSVLTKPTTNLHAFLLACLTSWSDYTEPQKHQIISSLPGPYQIRNVDVNGNLECPLSVDFLREDPYLREGIERFKRDVAEGYLDPTWRKSAAIAMREREEGKFDEYLRDKVESEFGDSSLGRTNGKVARVIRSGGRVKRRVVGKEREKRSEEKRAREDLGVLRLEGRCSQLWRWTIE